MQNAQQKGMSSSNGSGTSTFTMTFRKNVCVPRPKTEWGKRWSKVRGFSLEIIEILKERPMTITEVKHKTNKNWGYLAKYLYRLKSYGLIEKNNEYWSVNNEKMSLIGRIEKYNFEKRSITDVKNATTFHNNNNNNYTNINNAMTFTMTDTMTDTMTFPKCYHKFYDDKTRSDEKIMQNLEKNGSSKPSSELGSQGIVSRSSKKNTHTFSSRKEKIAYELERVKQKILSKFTVGSRVSKKAILKSIQEELVYVDERTIKNRLKMLILSNFLKEIDKDFCRVVGDGR
jgi:predicted transcriptional regulator